ncbi:peptidyl-tRNA hydrolase [Tenggerimyces flavus]|nr:peptidyl-tRNA hydrolase [Tenggerimyces flavus]
MGLNAVQAKVLQAQVDKEVAKRGGTQISANEVLCARVGPALQQERIHGGVPHS